MTRLAFLKKYLPRFAISLTLIALIVYTLYHVFASSSESLMKTSIQHHTEYRAINGKAYLFRDEEVIVSPRDGLVNDLVATGTKVGRDGPLVEVWDCPTSLLKENQAYLNDINTLIGVLEDSKLPAGTSLSQAGQYRSEVIANYEALLTAVAKGDWSQVGALEGRFLTLLNQYTALTDPTNKGVDETLAALKAERSRILTGVPLTLRNEKASGYYYGRSFIDGYESLFTPEALAALTPEAFAALTEAQPSPPSNGIAVGKTVYGYEWSLAMSISHADASYIDVDQSYAIRFPENRDCELTLTCVRLIDSEAGVIAVFTCNERLTEFAYLRVQTAVITVGSCSGFSVPEAAIYVENGVEGIYLLRESVACFQPIRVLYRGDGYCVIADKDAPGDDPPVLYDILITSGRNLHDGRVYQ